MAQTDSGIQIPYNDERYVYMCSQERQNFTLLVITVVLTFSYRT